MDEETLKRLEEIRARDEARTQGEWVHVESASGMKHYVCAGIYERDGQSYDEMRMSLQVEHPFDGHETRAEADCEYAARNSVDVPWLLDLVERLACERDAYAKAKRENDDRFVVERDQALEECARLAAENERLRDRLQTPHFEDPAVLKALFEKGEQ